MLSSLGYSHMSLYVPFQSDRCGKVKTAVVLGKPLVFLSWSHIHVLLLYYFLLSKYDSIWSKSVCVNV